MFELSWPKWQHIPFPSKTKVMKATQTALTGPVITYLCFYKWARGKIINELGICSARGTAARCAWAGARATACAMGREVMAVPLCSPGCSHPLLECCSSSKPGSASTLGQSWWEWFLWTRQRSETLDVKICINRLKGPLRKHIRESLMILQWINNTGDY